ncbi:hypothetical protein QYP06_32035 [Pseudomonas aeruginosa]|nr:hypothetical protein [Pseudomonas aeruginosa]
MKQALIGTAISLLLSASLYFGQGSLHQFAFYVAAATNVLCWLLIFAGGIKGQGAANLLAKRDERSMNSVIIIALREYLHGQRRKHALLDALTAATGGH